jgi:hypothetical protein
MKKQLAIVGGIAALFALALAPLAEAANGGMSGHASTAGIYFQPSAPVMETGVTEVETTPSSVEPTPFAHPLVKAGK